MTLQIKNAIAKELEGLPEHFIVAVTSSTEKYSQVSNMLTDYLVNTRRLEGIYVTMNKPYEALIAHLKKTGINTNRLFFVDAISGGIEKEKTKEEENCIFLACPSALTELSIVITKACNVERMKFLLFDSLSTMAVYNSESTTARFIHSLTTQLRKHKMSGVVFSLEKDMEKQVLASITQFCDKVIHVG